MKHTALFAVASLLAATVAPAFAASNDDAVLAGFFAMWDDNARVTPQAVAAHYGQHVVYYGRSMTPSEVYADKRAFVRRWPNRHYAVVPGSVRKTCNAAFSQCDIEVILAWRASSAERSAAAGGQSRVHLVLIREDGELKIVHESGRPVRG